MQTTPVEQSPGQPITVRASLFRNCTLIIMYLLLDLTIYDDQYGNLVSLFYPTSKETWQTVMTIFD